MNKFDNMQHYFKMDAEVNKTRVKLNFQEIVFQHFQFLIDNYGFQRTGNNLLLVRYESKNVFVEIYHDRLSYELELYIGIKESKNESKENGYSLVEILNLAGNENLPDFKVTTPLLMENGIIIMAELLQKHALKGILGDHVYYDQLDKIRNKMSQNVMIYYKENGIVPLVEKAWKKKDYKMVAKLLGAYEEYLTVEEKNKLEYARKQVNKETD